MATITLTINTGGEAVSTGHDVATLLNEVAAAVRFMSQDQLANGTIRDAVIVDNNGNHVGKWSHLQPEDDGMSTVREEFPKMVTKACAEDGRLEDWSDELVSCLVGEAIDAMELNADVNEDELRDKAEAQSIAKSYLDAAVDNYLGN